MDILSWELQGLCLLRGLPLMVVWFLAFHVSGCPSIGTLSHLRALWSLGPCVSGFLSIGIPFHLRAVWFQDTLSSKQKHSSPSSSDLPSHGTLAFLNIMCSGRQGQEEYVAVTLAEDLVTLPLCL